MDYKAMSEEYYETAKGLKRTIGKYKNMLKGSKCNREYVNAQIAGFRSIYYDVVNTAKLLENRAKGGHLQ